jgi:glycosyltransferase involved in cell wall biosynthesis
VVAILDLEPDPHPFELALRETGVELVPLRLPPRAYLRERALLRETLRGLDAQVVHTHGYRADLQAGSVARSLGIATVSTVHGFTGGDLRNRAYEWLQEAALRRFDGVIAVSRPILERLRARGVPGPRLHCLPNAWGGRRDLLQREQARSALGLPGDAFVIGWVGRLSHEKGPDVVVDALARARRDSICCLVGHGPEADALARQAAVLGIAPRLRFAGMQPAASRLFRAFDVLALSSRTEGTPIVLFEAMDAGIPIVATRVGGVPHVLGDDAAWLIEPDDPDALARALDGVRDDPGRALQRASVARRYLDDRFRLEPWIDAHETLYRRVLGARSG